MARVGSCICEDGEGEKRDLIFLCQAYGDGSGGLSGAESAVERGERDFEIDCVGGGGRLDGVVFKDSVLQ